MPSPVNLEWGEVSETGNWNVAADFVKFKIMKPLMLIDEYIDICHFGTGEMVDEFVIDDNTKNVAKLKAMKRLVKELRKVIGNTYFALKKSDKPFFTEYKTTLEKIWGVLPALEERITQNGKLKKIEINEDKFNKVLDILENMHDDILTPLNKANMIFTAHEEFDPDKLKEALKKRLTDRG